MAAVQDCGEPEFQSLFLWNVLVEVADEPEIAAISSFNPCFYGMCS